MGNVKKCLGAGYDQVIILFLEENKMIALKDLIRKDFLEEERVKCLYRPSL